jgi:hypothetical protein
MDDSIAARFVQFMNSRMPRPEQVEGAVMPRARAVGAAGGAVREGMGDGLDWFMRALAGEHKRGAPMEQMPPAVVPGVEQLDRIRRAGASVPAPRPVPVPAALIGGRG